MHSNYIYWWFMNSVCKSHLRCFKSQMICYPAGLLVTRLVISGDFEWLWSVKEPTFSGVMTWSPTGGVMRLTPVIFVSFSGILTNPSGWHHLLGSCSQTDNSTTQSIQIQALSSHSLGPADLQGKMCQIYPPSPSLPPPSTTIHRPRPVISAPLESSVTSSLASTFQRCLWTPPLATRPAGWVWVGLGWRGGAGWRRKKNSGSIITHAQKDRGVKHFVYDI